MPQLLRRLGTRDAALIVMGGIIGSGIFMNPSVVARLLQSGPLAIAMWCVGGGVALLGAFLFAELAARRPADGGLYAYMRDAFHPVVAFAYGWTLLLVSQSGGMAAAAVTFSAYFLPLTGLRVDERILATAIIAVLTLVNCLGVREAASTQNAFMIVKIVAILGLIGVGLFAPHASHAAAAVQHLTSSSPGLLAAMGLALVAVMFSYSGWQTASFMSAELREPKRSLPLGMLYGVAGVIVLYLAVNVVCLVVLGQHGLAATQTPASDVARIAMGPIGERIMALVVALSTLGFLSNQILVAPRVYFQMAADGVFFKQLSWVHPRTHAPVTAIVLQGVIAIVIAVSGTYNAILNYVTSIDDIFFGLAAIALFVFIARDRRDGSDARVGFRMPGHPVTTILFLVVCWGIVLNLWVKAPQDSLVGLAILLIAVPVYALFRRSAQRTPVRQ